MLKCFALVFIVIALPCFAFKIDEIICSPKQYYTVKKYIDKGSFGKVYKITDSKNKIYALKSCIAGSKNTDSFTKLLGDAQREFQRGQTLNHLNIIKSFEIFIIKTKKSKEMVNLVLEFVDGQTLYDTEENTVPYEKNHSALNQFIDALLHAVSLDLLHLDLHEENVMLTKNYDIKVIDLASFFTIQEIIKFNIIIEMVARRAPSKQFNKNELKIQKFLGKRPNLLEELCQIDVEINDFLIPDDKIRDHVKSSQQQNKIFESYFYDVTDMCFDILQKSNLEKKKKDAINRKIELLNKEYSASVKNKKIVNISDYLHKLKKAIN